MKRTLSILVILAAAIPLNAQLLPNEADLPKLLSEIDPSVGNTLRINRYVDQKRKDYTQNVTCPGSTDIVGKLEFQSSAYTGDFNGGNLNDFMGFAIRGGFKLANGYQVCNGMTMRWLQYVKVSNQELNNGTTPADSGFIDGSPLYPDFPIAGFSGSLFDAPGRGTVGANNWKKIDWRAESALVCWDGNKALKYMGTFKWGFSISTDNAGAKSVTGTYPGGWTNGLSNDFSTEFSRAYGTWTLEQGCCVCPVPEPASIAALGVGALALLRRRKK